MLRLIVDRGADAAVPPESMFLTDFAAEFDAGGPRDEQAAARLMEEVWQHPKVRLWDLPARPPAVPRETRGLNSVTRPLSGHHGSAPARHDALAR